MTPEPESTDPGASVLELLFRRMQIDSQWAVRADREFSWWPHDLRQRVWASPLREEKGVTLCDVHVETDLVAGAQDLRDTFDTVIWMNRSVMLSALVFEQGHIRLRAAVAVNAGNLPFASELALHAMALQLVEAASAAETLVSKGCGVRDTSAHPVSGARSQPDQMLEVGGLYADPARTAPQIDFARLSQSSERCWLQSEADASGFTAIFPLDTGSSGIVDMVKQQEGLGTALFQATTAEAHPAIGAGVLAAVRLPDVPLDARRAANMLNVVSTTAPEAHALGAWWYSDEYGITLSAFYPALAFRKENAEFNYRLFESIVWHMATSAAWARRMLTRDKRPDATSQEPDLPSGRSRRPTV